MLADQGNLGLPAVALHPQDGPPVEALDRMIAASWQHLARYQAMAAIGQVTMTPRARETLRRRPPTR